MSDGVSTLHIKQEIETSSSGAITFCCSPSTSTTIGVNRSNSYSNGTSTSSSSGGGGGVGGSGGGGGVGNASTSTTSHTSGGIKSSPSVSPERQLCSSTTTLSSDLHSVSLNTNESSSNANGVTGGGGVSIRDEIRRLCLVCGDIASGFHYGVASCEACKAFFKRTIQGNIEYTCPANNECEINKRRRKACQACRFQKCLLMGMLKEGVRLDRVRGGRQKYRRNPVSNCYQTMQSNTASLDDVKVLYVLNIYEPETLTVQEPPHTSDDSLECSPKVKNESDTPTPTAITTCIFQNNNNDPQEILCVLSELYDKELVGAIGWAKQIPGFMDLPIDDQMKLLQVSWTEILTLQMTFRSLPFNGKLCFATDVWMDEQLAKECGYEKFYYHCVQIAQRLERLSARREEYFLLKALLLSNCDILLDDQSALRAFRDSILNSLNDVVCLLRHSSAVSHQQQLLLLLPSLRQVDGILRNFWRKVCADGAVTMKQLFIEMLASTSR